MGFRVFRQNWVLLNITILNFDTRVLMVSNGLFPNHCPKLQVWFLPLVGWSTVWMKHRFELRGSVTWWFGTWDMLSRSACLSQRLDSPIGTVIPALWWAVYLSAFLIRCGTMHLSHFCYFPSAQQGAWNTEVLSTYLLNKWANEGINEWMNGCLPGYYP